jgi:hypothetical protein
VKACSAYLTDEKRNLTFSLSSLEEGLLFRGFEDIPGRLSWVGLNYTFRPRHRVLRFKIGFGEPQRE